jgi:LacI family transcriptional regulator
VTVHAARSADIMTTLNEIARRANVSVGTVDRVIHKRGRVSEVTREKVLRLIEELDYRPNVLARNLSLKKVFNFGVLTPSPEQDGGYWELPITGVHKALDELRVYNVQLIFFHYDKYSEDSFRNICQNVREELEKLDGLLIAPVLSKASEQFICQLPKEVPYVFFDSYIPDSQCLTYIGQESYQSGILAAKLMTMKFESGKIGVFRVLPVDYHIEDRVRGFQSVIEQNSNYQMLTLDVNRDIDMHVFDHVSERLIDEHPDIRGIFVPSACTHQVADTLIKRKRANSITLIGYDLVEENRKHLKNGVIDFIISQNPSLQGYQGIYSLFKHIILKEPVESKLVVPMDILTSDNVDYYQG